MPSDIPRHPRCNLTDTWVAPPRPDAHGIVRHADGLTVHPIRIPMTAALADALAQQKVRAAEARARRLRATLADLTTDELRAELARREVTDAG